MMSLSLLTASLLIGVGAPLAHAQSRAALATIDGVVTDTSLVSLADATASILGYSIRAVTGANGRFQILGLPAGQYILVVRHLGYAPSSTAVQVAGGDTLRVSFALERIVTALDTVVVATKRLSMRMAEFEERRKVGNGEFMTQAEIEKRNTVFATELIRTFVSVRVVAGNATNARFPVGTRFCPFQIFVDGVALPIPTSLDNLPTPKILAGIEVYSGPTRIPLQYKTIGGAFCGVILVWTKDGP